jgi:RNA polymerase sigma-32 factor
MTLQSEGASASADGAHASCYLAEVRRFPVLERHEEIELARRWRERGDRNAADRLVISHLRLVAKIARGYRGYGLATSELISEGHVGLMHAVNRFDPELGFRFSTYAIWWIRAAIQEYVLRSWSLVRIGTTANQKKLFFSLRQAKSRIAALNDGELRPNQVEIISDRLGVAKRDVIEMNCRLGRDISLNAPMRDDDDAREWQDRLIDDAVSAETQVVEDQEAGIRRKGLREALAALNARERRILEGRHLAERPATLEELANEFGVSRERVRQIEVRAFEKIQKAVKRHVAAIEGA